MPTQALREILSDFFSAFTSAPTFDNFVTLLTGWILCTGRHTISRVIQFGRDGRGRHHSALYRFFSRAKWDTDALSRVLLRLVLPFVPDGALVVILDDTLCRKSGPHIWGGGMHRDPVGSTYGGADGSTIQFAFGHSWATLSIWVPLPWRPDRGLAVPLLWRLYRPKKRCPARAYRKRTELANEMLATLRSWIAPRPLLVLGDADYACRTVVHDQPEDVTFVGSMDMDAAVFALPLAKRGMGRPRLKGERLPSPRKLAANDSIAWKRRRVHIYGRDVDLLVKTQVCLWYRVAGTRPVRMIVTRDPKGRINDRAYFSTDAQHGVEEIATLFSRRWAEEVMHRDVKQHLGLEDPQNGWWRRPAGRRAKKKVAGPQAHATRGEHAVRHTAPLAFITYAVVVVWYLRRDSIAEDVAIVKRRAPWYRHKREPSFSDMLAAARREVWAGRLSEHRTLRPVSKKVTDFLSGFLLVA